MATVIKTVPYNGMRKAIGVNMSASWSLAPKVDYHGTADVTDIMAFREKLNANIPEAGSKVSFNDMILKVVADAIREFPIVNSSLKDNVIEVYQEVNIGMAVALDNGLVVPVVKGIDAMDIYTIANETKKLVEKARNKKIVMEDITGGTFTVSNLGSTNSVDFFSPIINQPESAILGIGRAKKCPAVMENDEIKIRSVMGLSLAADHRIIDGAPAAQFLAILIKLLEQPEHVNWFCHE